MNELKQVIVVHNGIKMQISQAKKIEEAVYFYMNYENKILSCKSKYGSAICENLKQANDFFKNPPNKKRNKVRPIKTLKK